MRSSFVAAVAMILALAMPAGADHCTSWSSSVPEIDAAGRYYADPDCWQPSCPALFSMFVYEETNGLEGLQRGDEVVDDTCHGMIAPDTIIF